ncbi:MAG: hypothetical protein WA705_30350 [Candidatus Ozemobacteraceae bacterium]
MNLLQLLLENRLAASIALILSMCFLCGRSGMKSEHFLAGLWGPLAALLWGLILARFFPPVRLSGIWPGGEFVLLDSRFPLAFSLILGWVSLMLPEELASLRAWAVLAAPIADSGILDVGVLIGGVMRFSASEGVCNVVVFLPMFMAIAHSHKYFREMRDLLTLAVMTFWGLVPAAIMLIYIQSRNNSKLQLNIAKCPICLPWSW